MQEFHALLELLVMLAVDPRTAVLFVLLTLAAISDCRSYRIPNALTFGGAAFALAYQAAVAVSPATAFLLALGGLFLGFLVMLPLYALGVMGAGDVKLMAMAGAFLGVDETFQAVLFVFIAGGIAAMGFALFRRKVAQLLRNAAGVACRAMGSTLVGVRVDVRNQAHQSIGKLPYGICISVGTMGYVLGRQLGYV